MISDLRTFSRVVAMAAAALAASASTPATPTSTVVPAGPPTERLVVDGLRQPVEILRDRWGIAHIYAQNEDDLFFAQGYNAARDRLFQFEVWRRQATGTVAEILGRRELRRDIGARLLRFRGDLHTELNHYHPRGEAIVNAFVRGVNAYIGETERDPSLLPLEFGLLGIKPERWTPDVVISRHQGLVSNLTQELAIGRAVAAVGEKAVRDVYWFQPGSPDLTLDPILTRDALSSNILELYSADRSSLRFRPEDLATHTNPPSDSPGGAPRDADEAFAPLAEWNALLSGQPRPHVGSVPIDPWGWGGSNNWVVSGRLTASGMPMMANDPHRAQSVPSLRYYVHLVAPGWNVIGGGEPELPGVSIGHNEFGAWGLTVFGVDGEDLYVYQTNPSNPRQYRYDGGWEDMRVIRDTIPVEGESPVPVELEYTRHGPVLYRDSVRHLAFALRAAWLDIGASPYLASLRMDQARSWEEFRVACSYSRLPAENMVWADRDGNIGWQAVGGAPIRPNWSGLVPVPGDGRYEWQGYLPIPELPHVANPDKGWWATANNNLIPAGYSHRDAVAWTWSDPFRRDRIDEVLGSGRKHSLADMMRLQHDELAIPARMLVPLLRSALPATNAGRQARDRLLDWDYVLDRNSTAAAIYVEWERQLSEAVEAVVIPKPVRDVTGSPQLSLIVQWLLTPDGRFGSDPIATRDRLLAESLDRAAVALRERLGADMSSWKWGDTRNHHALIRHPMSGAVDAELRRKLDVGPAPRGGYGLTVNATGSGANQTSGASFRIITDLSDWDHAVGTNTPGQSGNPDDSHYADLFPLWAAGEYFPVFYSREKVESVTESRFQLIPSR